MMSNKIDWQPATEEDATALIKARNLSFESNPIADVHLWRDGDTPVVLKDLWDNTYKINRHAHTR